MIHRNFLIAIASYFFFFTSQAHANPFANPTLPQVSARCHFQEVYSAYAADYIWFNILEKTLVRLEDGEANVNQFRSFLDNSMAETLSACGRPEERFYNIESLSNIEISAETYVFRLFDKQHKIMLTRDGGRVSYIYKQYQNSRSQFITFMHSRRQSNHFLSHRILGRLGTEMSSQRYYLLYSPEGALVDSSSAVTLNRNMQDFDSLVSIYGNSYSEALASNPKVVVGVIGSGVDYNHPMLAKHLLGRQDFEDDVAEIKFIEDKIITYGYDDFSELESDIQGLGQLKEDVGFPTWMDQALGSHRPFDQIIQRIPNRPDTHETTMAGRIVVNQGDIGLVSVRKAYLNAANENLLEIFQNFHWEL